MTNRRQVSGRSTRAPPPRLRAWGSPGIPRSIDLDCCFCHRCAAVLTNASWSHLAFRLPRDLRSRHPEDRARDVGWGELNTAGAPLGCTEPRKREATGGNGTPVSRSGRRSRVIRRGVPTFNSPLAHVVTGPGFQIRGFVHFGLARRGRYARCSVAAVAAASSSSFRLLVLVSVTKVLAVPAGDQSAATF